MQKNQLSEYFQSNTGRLIHKWHHYFEVYEKHFSRFVGKEIVILEIGVYQGGSLQMWKNYFGDKCKIYGIDIEPRSKQFEEEQIEIFIGSQSDRKFLRDVVSKIPQIDIIIDDGGHTMKQQIVSYEELFKHIKPDGVYLCEDCHTSYWPEYGGGYKRKGSFIEYSKQWIDQINAFHSRTPELPVNDFTRSVKSVHYYDSIVVLEKSPIEKPITSMTGNRSYEDYVSPIKTGFFAKLERWFKRKVNKISYKYKSSIYFED
ncbi:MAG: class I SAM-dependent methyltransferase [Sphingobacteriaceae bacterium]|nr:class I SAM-dependent methyltransferase [Sphingobacteriaceae bacterium]